MLINSSKREQKCLFDNEKIVRRIFCIMEGDDLDEHIILILVGDKDSRYSIDKSCKKCRAHGLYCQPVFCAATWPPPHIG